MSNFVKHDPKYDENFPCQEDFVRGPIQLQEAVVNVNKEQKVFAWNNVTKNKTFTLDAVASKKLAIALDFVEADAHSIFNCQCPRGQKSRSVKAVLVHQNAKKALFVTIDCYKREHYVFVRVYKREEDFDSVEATLYDFPTTAGFRVKPEDMTGKLGQLRVWIDECTRGIDIGGFKPEYSQLRKLVKN